MLYQVERTPKSSLSFHVVFKSRGGGREEEGRKGRKGEKEGEFVFIGLDSTDTVSFLEAT